MAEGGPVGDFGGTVADQDLGVTNFLARTRVRAQGTRNARPVRMQATAQLERFTPLDVERLEMALRQIRIDSSSGKLDPEPVRGLLGTPCFGPPPTGPATLAPTYKAAPLGPWKLRHQTQ